MNAGDRILQIESYLVQSVDHSCKCENFEVKETPTDVFSRLNFAKEFVTSSQYSSFLLRINILVLTDTSWYHKTRLPHLESFPSLTAIAAVSLSTT
jgi:hypothetical protein